MSGTPFLPGRARTGGRAKGVKNRLSHKFLEDLEAEWQEGGRDALKVCRIEKPVEFARLVAGLLPREFELEINTTVTEISDDEIRTMLDEIHRRREAGSAAKLIDGRVEPAPDREPARLLQAISDPETIP